MLQQAGGVRADFQPVARLHGAGGVDLAGFHVLDDAHAARAVDGELGIIAEGGHVNSGLPDDGQDVLLAVERHAQPVDNHCSLGHDLTLLFNGVDGAEGTCAPARAAVDAFFRVDGVRHADLTVDGADGTVAQALAAALAQLRIDLQMALAAVADGAVVIDDMGQILLAEVAQRALHGLAGSGQGRRAQFP